MTGDQATTDVVKTELARLSDNAFDRLMARIDTLTDDEYLWEPAPNAWSVRPGDDGRLEMQFGVVIEAAPPVTTIAWRLTHIIDLLSEERCATWIGVVPETENLFAAGAPGTAASARDLLAAANARWHRYLQAWDSGTLLDKVGPIGRQFAGATRMMFVLHIIDELIHHAAEVGVLRDLFRVDQPDPVVAALLSGDRQTLAGLGPDALDLARRDHPDLILTAAETARWDCIPLLIELGFDLTGKDGRTPLHHAAAGGRTELVRLLLDSGVPITSRDPTFHATAADWAQFFGRSKTAELLQKEAGSR